MSHILFLEPRVAGHVAYYLDSLVAHVAARDDVTATFAVPPELLARLSAEGRAALEATDQTGARVRLLDPGDLAGLHRLGGLTHNVAKHLRPLDGAGGTRLTVRLLLAALRVLPGGLVHGNVGRADVRYHALLERLLVETGADQGFSFYLNCAASGVLASGASGAAVSGLLVCSTADGGPGSAAAEPHELATARYDVRVLKRLLVHPRMHRVFVYDRAIAEQWGGEGGCRHLPDFAPPLPGAIQAPLLPPELAEPDRVLFLLFGALTRRKGLLVTLEAISRLDPALAGRAAFAFVGRFADGVRPAVLERIERVRRRQPSVAIHLHEAYVAEAELAGWVERADVILAPYGRWHTSSGVLYWAARAQTPVICQDYGLMARQALAHGLGRVVETRCPGPLSTALGGVLQAGREGLAGLGDRDGMQRFCADSTATAFASTIVDALIEPSGAD